MKATKRIAMVSAVAVVLAWGISAQAATILDVDFDLMTAGATAEPALDAATTGGTWELNSYSSGGQSLAHSIENDGGGLGDKAFFSSFPASSAEPPLFWAARIDLDSPVDVDVDLAAGDLQITFETAQSTGTGYTRDVFWRVFDGTTLLTEIKVDDANVWLGGTNLGGLGIGPNTGLGSWDSTSSLVWTVSITIDSAGNLDLDFAGITGSTTISPTANITRLETALNPDRWNGQGVYLNDITFDVDTGPVIPEPATMAALGLAACGLGGYVRKRRKA